MARGFMNLDAARLGTANNVAVATTSTAVASSAFGAQTFQIRVCAPAACVVKVSEATPTAAATDAYLPPNWEMYINVSPGQKISAFSPTIQTVSVVEITQ
jgi:hypothetical protein